MQKYSFPSTCENNLAENSLFALSPRSTAVALALADEALCRHRVLGSEMQNLLFRVPKLIVLACKTYCFAS